MYGKLTLIILMPSILMQLAKKTSVLEYFSFDSDYASVDDDLNHDIHSLVRKHGYPFETHTVTTEDGYILQLHRLPSRAPPKMAGNAAVLLQHGIFVSSMVWLLEGPHRALAYRLAAEGFDVWLGNSRGNVYSRQHVSIDRRTDPKAYYNYSFHEIGVYDLAASIDYVLNATRQAQIDYVAHSQGCVALFVLMSERREYQAKVGRMIAMAPGVFTQHAWAPALVLGRLFRQQVEWLWRMLQIHEIFSSSNFGGKYATSLICADGAALQVLCRALFYLIAGYNPSQVNTTLLPMFFTHAPCGGSTKQVLHYLQISPTGVFRQFDYGPRENVATYGQQMAPAYDLSNVALPIHIFYSENDSYSPENDTMKLAAMLPNVQQLEKVQDKYFTHFNFMLSRNVYNVLNIKVINALLN